MPRYFKLQTSEPIATRADADVLADALNDSAKNLGVRIVSIRRASDRAYVFAYSELRKQSRNSVVACLRTRFTSYRFSEEHSSSDGPFS